MKKLIFPILVLGSFLCHAQLKIPLSYSNLNIDHSGGLRFENQISKINAFVQAPEFTLSNLIGNPTGSARGIDFNFRMKNFNGTLFFGFIPQDDSKHPFPVYFKKSTPIENGLASVNIKDQLSGMYDMVNWSQKEKGVLGYRLVSETGKLLYDGKVAFKGSGPFQVVPTIIEGPFINKLTDDNCVISFVTNRAVLASIKIEYKVGYDTKIKEYRDATSTKVHEIELSKLIPETDFIYEISYGGEPLQFSFTTPPEKGSRKPFTFAYASDSRFAAGGGERNLYGTNYYIMKKIMALAHYEGAAFMQFTGDMVNGYCIDKKEIEIQYANWKRSIETFAHYMPVYVGMGNHECVMWLFIDEISEKKYMIDKFPFETESSEAVFAGQFVHFENGPEGEDGSSYDPDPRSTDFPTYKENVYYYVYDNMAMVVLNSDYWYAPSLFYNVLTSGNIHGYLMDNQMQWLRQTLKKLESDKSIDHVFITQHTPVFPNGGHVADDMWYGGNNLPRPVVGGTAVKKGILERRDEYLQLLVNESPKVVAILTGDEHNYNKLELGPETEIYPTNYKKEKIKLNRKLFQINNGAAGAPYYAQEVTPWTPHVSNFSTQNALVLIDVEGTKVKARVLNPDTLESIDEFILRE